MTNTEVINYKKNQKVFLEKQAIRNVYFLVSGNVRTYKNDIVNNKLITIELINESNFFGYHEVISDGYTRKTSASVISKTAIIQKFNIVDFRNELFCNKEFYWDILLACNRHQNILWNRILKIRMYNSRRKIGYELISIANTKNEVRDKLTIQNYSHQLLAEYTGSSRQTITSTLNYFRRLGVIEYDRKKIIINVEMLKDNLKLI